MTAAQEARNIESWRSLQMRLAASEERPAWKELADPFMREGQAIGLDRFFRAGSGMWHLIISTLDQNGLNDEPRATIILHPPDRLVVAYGRDNLSFNDAEIAYLLPFEFAFPTFRRLLNQLWTATVPEGIPEALRTPLDAPLLSEADRWYGPDRGW